MNWIGNSPVGAQAGRQTNSPRGFVGACVCCLLGAFITTGLDGKWVVAGSVPDLSDSQTQGLQLQAELPSSSDACQAFKTFLESPLLVRRVRYTHDPSHYRVNGKPIAFPVEYEAAVQGDTFYIRRVTDLNNPTSPPSAQVVGASRSDYWIVDGLTVVLADQEDAVSGQNVPPKVEARGNLRFLHDVLSLGLDGLERDTLEWKENQRFLGQSRNRGYIRGELIMNDDRVSGLIYIYDSAPGMTCRVDYAYLRDDLPYWLPSRVVRTLYFNDGSSHATTNEILECVLGVEQLPVEGYTPARFVGDVAFTNLSIMVFSNGVGYLHRGGQVIRTVLPSEAWKVHPSQHKWIRLGFFLMVASVMLICCLLYARGRPRSGKWAKPN